MAFDIYQTVTDRIVATLEAGIAGECIRPWHRTGGSGLPTNGSGRWSAHAFVQGARSQMSRSSPMVRMNGMA